MALETEHIAQVRCTQRSVPECQPRPASPTSPRRSLLTRSRTPNTTHRGAWFSAQETASAVISRATHLRNKLGHENQGFLSLEHGFMPFEEPCLALPQPFSAWDKIATELPELHRTLTLRKRVEQLPLLCASESNLADVDLLRACSVLALLSHSYWYANTTPPETLPVALSRPWKQIRQRLGRRDEAVSYIDLVVYNWRLVERGPDALRRIENMRLLFPTVGNQEEHVFYLVQAEILERAAPIVGAAAKAQEAALRDDPDAVERQLVVIIDSLASIVRYALPKISANAYSRSHVEPIVWAKTVAPFAVPMKPGVQGPSGTSSPIFSLLDSFFGRKRKKSFLGREIEQLRRIYPPHWRALLQALDNFPVAAYVSSRGHESLQAAFAEGLSLYASEEGFLGRHRMKVYGFLELAFKVGRSVTIGGFSGAFQDRTWDQVDGELRASQAERDFTLPMKVRQARILQQSQHRAGHLCNVTLSTNTAIHCSELGARCSVLPENSDALVERTIAALSATGTESLVLTPEWVHAMRMRWPQLSRKTLLLKDILRFGAIRTVSARLAEALHARTQNAALLAAIIGQTTKSWELWELLHLLHRDGFDPRTLYSSEAPHSQPTQLSASALCELIPPEAFRTYSVGLVQESSASDSNVRLQLTVAPLKYQSASAQSNSRRTHAAAPPVSVTRPTSSSPSFRYGAASSYLIREISKETTTTCTLSLSTRFVLPEDPITPVVLFAGGSGIAPLRNFLRRRMTQQRVGPCWLFLSLKHRADFLFEQELEDAMRYGRLRLNVVFTRDNATLSLTPQGQIVVTDGKAARMDEVMLDDSTAEELHRWLQEKDNGGLGAHVYICGNGSLGDAVTNRIQKLFERFGQGRAEHRQEFAATTFKKLCGQGRLLQELYAALPSYDGEMPTIERSFVAEHNDHDAGYLMIIEDQVYDVTAFIDLHPGGRSIVLAYAGMDATRGYRRAHGTRHEPDAMLPAYQIGKLRVPKFEPRLGEAQTKSGPKVVDLSWLYRAWTNALDLCVEMQNALRLDHSLRQKTTVSGEQSKANSRYKVSRALETHQRFLCSYLEPLLEETLPNLASVTRALFPPSSERHNPTTLGPKITALRTSKTARWLLALSRGISRALEHDQLDLAQAAQIARVLEREDAQLLSSLKWTLIQGVRVLEQRAQELHKQDSPELLMACTQLHLSVAAYYERLAQELKQRTTHLWLTSAALAPATPPQRSALRRVCTTSFWQLEQDTQRKVAVLARNPRSIDSLSELAKQNSLVLQQLDRHHRDFGLVVDVRQAPLRNDPSFESAMSELRRRLTEHFARTVILVQSRLGSLQVERLERNEQRNSLVTRCETTALRFARTAV